MESSEFIVRVGENIRRTRWAAELTQEGLAARGFSLRHVQLMERGTGNPTLVTLHELARALETTVAALVDIDPDETLKAKAALAKANPSPPKRGRKRRVVP